MMKIFKTELGLFVKSLTFLAFILAAFALYFTQYQSSVNHQITQLHEAGRYDAVNYFMKPTVTSKDFGESYQIDHQVLMKDVLGTLQMNYQENTYPTYPLMFLKNVHLNKRDQQKIRDAYERLMQQPITQKRVTKVTWKKFYQRISYAQFLKTTRRINAIIGGRSIYQTAQLTTLFASGKKFTYKTALQNYHQKLKVDQLTRPFARLFSDYMGIIMMLFSIFPILLYFTKEAREHCQDVFGGRTLPTWRYLGYKFLVVVGTLYVAVLLLAIFPTFQLIKVGQFLNVTVDPFAFFKTISLFVLPTLIFITAVILLLVQLFNPVLTLIMSLGLSLFTLGVTDINGYTTWSPLIRFNIADNWVLYHKLEQSIYLNRLCYLALSIILFFLAVWVNSIKRGDRRDDS